MSIKIDLDNHNNNRQVKLNIVMNRSSGSKTAKPRVANDRVQKRRGRRPKKIIDNVELKTQSAPTKNEKNNSSVILRLNIDPTKLKNIKSKRTAVQDQSDSTDESFTDMFNNDIPNDSVCAKCVKNEKTIGILKGKLEKYEKQNKLNNTNKIYHNRLSFISYTTNKKVTIKKTNLLCLWDSHNFETLPCVLPELYHNETYYITGCFCSFNCALAHNLYYLKDAKIYQRKSLLYKLYREMYDIEISEPIDIKEAPPREILASFGGTMTIQEFRNSFTVMNKEYIVYVPPLKPISLIIEERTTDATNTEKETKYVQKRSKPLSKKHSIMSFMKTDPDETSN